MSFSQDVNMFPESICEVLALNTTQIFLYSMLKLSHFEGERKRSVFVCPFKCKWAAALIPGGGATTACFKMFKVLCSNQSQTMMEILKKKWQHVDISEWLVYVAFVLLSSSHW